MVWRGEAGGGGVDRLLYGWAGGGWMAGWLAGRLEGEGGGGGGIGECCSRSMQGGCADHLPLGLIT